MIMEKQGSPKKGLHFLLAGGERKGIDRLFPAVRELPLAMGDFISKKGNRACADKRFLDF